MWDQQDTQKLEELWEWHDFPDLGLEEEQEEKQMILDLSRNSRDYESSEN